MSERRSGAKHDKVIRVPPAETLVQANALGAHVAVRTSQRGSQNSDCRVDGAVRGDAYASVHKVCAVPGARCSGCLVWSRWARRVLPRKSTYLNGRGSGSVTAPTGWVELIAPVQQRVDLKLYGFYIGELKAPSAQVDATIRVTKFLSITPSYLYYSVPASGLNELANVSRGFTRNLRGAPISDRRDGYVLVPQV